MYWDIGSNADELQSWAGMYKEQRKKRTENAAWLSGRFVGPFAYQRSLSIFALKGPVS